MEKFDTVPFLSKQHFNTGQNSDAKNRRQKSQTGTTAWQVETAASEIREISR
jgi:hypothetical protein